MSHSAGRPRFAVMVFAVVAMVIALIARLWLSWISWGTDDATLWVFHVTNIRRWGLLETYRREISLNHPPISTFIMRGVERLGQWMHWPATFGFRLPTIAADVASSLLLWRIYSRGKRPLLAPLAAVLMMWNLDAILVSAHHSNTDPEYAFLALLAAYFATEGSLFAAGLALGAAINIKLLPMILILPLLITCRTRKDISRAIGGLAIMAIPFIPLVLFAFNGLMRNMVNYKSQPDYWGIQLFLLEAARAPRLSGFAQPLVQSYSDFGRGIILLGVVYASLRCRKLGHSPLVAITCAACMFLVLTSGYGFQYSVVAVPLLLACSLFHGTLYGLLAGLYLLFSYLCVWDGKFPINTTGSGGLPYRGPALALGVLAWATLIHFLWRTLTTPAPSAEANPLA